jgi:chemotaxis protein CheD
MDRIVGISEYVVSTNPDDTLVTYSLGSCVGLSLHDPVAGVAGLLHSMMPTSKDNPEKAAENPAMYTDTGAQTLLKEMFSAGATRANLVAKVIGAASQVDQNGLFRIGERNHLVVRKVLWKNDILITAEDVGGATSRTVYVQVGSGKTTVRSEGKLREL